MTAAQVAAAAHGVLSSPHGTIDDDLCVVNALLAASARLLLPAMPAAGGATSSASGDADTVHAHAPADRKRKAEDQPAGAPSARREKRAAGSDESSTERSAGAPSGSPSCGAPEGASRPPARQCGAPAALPAAQPERPAADVPPPPPPASSGGGGMRRTKTQHTLGPSAHAPVPGVADHGVTIEGASARPPPSFVLGAGLRRVGTDDSINASAMRRVGTNESLRPSGSSGVLARGSSQHLIALGGIAGAHAAAAGAEGITAYSHEHVGGAAWRTRLPELPPLAAARRESEARSSSSDAPARASRPAAVPAPLPPRVSEEEMHHMIALLIAHSGCQRVIQPLVVTPVETTSAAQAPRPCDVTRPLAADVA
mmetsp:Transcript_17108/g.46284  ORF Transcript_17108/g.46284 Transcript_17108/m.46284 type:complete len:369 (+) Transcript_17108:54-1160(+)|eukprot:CAMPEP_0185182002 /NCGR_PEP_ID=MMETSP1140-20130426/1053_1 /TAXON_ID=298111 /ORGANISM="Pavlova sp., Strain CCMP459" /LENGTH=368 /DNA_ID=CAMNT_0027747917 /DNA_START=52 /DNA_END=1158 /DNA_ORIENTATION=-